MAERPNDETIIRRRGPRWTRVTGVVALGLLVLLLIGIAAYLFLVRERYAPKRKAI